MGKRKSNTGSQHPSPVAGDNSAAPHLPVLEPSQLQRIYSQQTCPETAASPLSTNPSLEQNGNGSSQPSDGISASGIQTTTDNGANLSSMVPSDNLIRSCLAREAEKDSEDECTSSDDINALCKLHENLEKANLFSQDCWLPDGDQFTVDSSGADTSQLTTVDSPTVHSYVADLAANDVDRTPVSSCGAQRYFGPVKRGVDHSTPSAKRSRCTPDMSLLQLDRPVSPPTSAQRATRGGDGLQWSGPSTYRLRCWDDLERSGPLPLAIVGSQTEEVAEVVFRPAYNFSPGGSPPRVAPDRPRRRLDYCASPLSSASPFVPGATQRLLDYCSSPLLPTPVSHAASDRPFDLCGSLLPQWPAPPVAGKRWPYVATSSVGMVDTHCHLDFLFRKLSFKGTFAKFRLLNENTFPDCYEGCVAIFCNPLTFNDRTVWENLLREDGIWAAFGCHPHMARDYDEETDEHLIKALDHPRVVALGEIGLDYSHKNFCQREMQKSVFQRQITLALERKLPLVIHSRDATEDTLTILKESIPKEYPVHRHCFTGNWAEASDWLDTFPGLCLGLTPLVGFADAGHLQEVARKIPLNRLLLETDAPYFLPKTESGAMRHSHPGMAIHVAHTVSYLKNISLDEVLRAVRVNTRRIYGI